MDYKDDYRATLDDGRRVLKRLRAVAKPLGYSTALYGSVVLEGKGHDVDVQMMGCDDQAVTPNELMMRIVRKHARSILLWEQQALGDMQDVWCVFATYDRLLVDLHVKGGE